MRRLLAWLPALCLLLIAAGALEASDGKVIKALPEFLDDKGHSALSPSLYERDAYQAYLRHHPLERKALQLAVQWKASGVNWNNVKLRAELRGVYSNNVSNLVLWTPVKKNGMFSSWTDFKIEGDEFKKFGELAAWRVTLWEGDKQLGVLQSFLWAGGEKPQP
jgi:hypothetical protein